MCLFWRACKNFLQFSNFKFLTSANTSAPPQHHPRTTFPNRPQNLRSNSLKIFRMINCTSRQRKWLRKAKNRLLGNAEIFYYHPNINFIYTTEKIHIYDNPKFSPTIFQISILEMELEWSFIATPNTIQKTDTSKTQHSVEPGMVSCLILPILPRLYFLQAARQNPRRQVGRSARLRGGGEFRGRQKERTKEKPFLQIDKNRLKSF